MNIVAFVKSLFAVSSCPSHATPNQVPPPAPKAVAKEPEPSYLAKGIAAAWINGEGWTVKMSRKTVVFGYSQRLVTLIHADLGVVIVFNDYLNGNIGDATVKVSGKRVIIDGCPISDWQEIKRAIKSRPYPALKRLLAQKDKDDATRASKIAAIEKLGCPEVAQ